MTHPCNVGRTTPEDHLEGGGTKDGAVGGSGGGARGRDLSGSATTHPSRAESRHPDRRSGPRLRHHRHRDQLAVDADLLPCGRRGAVDSDRPLRRLRGRSDHGPNVHPGTSRVLGSISSKDGHHHADRRDGDPGGWLSARTDRRQPQCRQSEPLLARRLVLRGRG